MPNRSASSKGHRKRARKREKRLVTLMVPQTLLAIVKIILWFFIEENHHR
jgi:hypothetical protein